jgi:spermidine/putrescine transport system substrate-binding protein
MNTVRSLLLLVAAGALNAAGCGATHNTATATAPPPSPAPASGTLRVFAYQDTVTDQLLGPFRRANPHLDVKTATFNSDEEASAKLRGGFQSDVIEVCLDEIHPLLVASQLRPLDPRGVPALDQIPASVRNAAGATAGGKRYVVPLEAGPEGLIYNTKTLPQGVHSFADLFSPVLKGKVALEGDAALPPIAETALALGYRDPMHLTNAQLDRVTSYLQSHRTQFRSFWSSDADAVNLMKSGEVVALDGGRGLAAEMTAAGVPVRWVRAREGLISWVCGLSISSTASNVAAAYKLINYYLSPPAQAIRARDGYVVSNPASLAQVPARFRTTADPAVLNGAIAESEPPNYPRWAQAWQRIQAG